MDIITGYTGKAHVTAEQDRDINQGIIGSGSYVLQTGMEMEAEVSSNNEIKIRDGVLMHQGCAASIKKNTYDSLTIINGSQGMNRIDLIVARYSRNKDSGVESLKLMVIQGTPTSGTATVPTYTKGDIQAGDYVADMPMYQVILSGLNITEVKKVFETAPNLTELNSNKTKRPDFSNVKKISWNGKTQSYTFTEDCYINVCNARSKTYGYGCELKINSVFLIHTSGSDSSTWQSAFVMVSKGDILTCNDYFVGDIDIIGTK